MRSIAPRMEDYRGSKGDTQLCLLDYRPLLHHGRCFCKLRSFYASFATKRIEKRDELFGERNRNRGMNAGNSVKDLTIQINDGKVIVLHTTEQLFIVDLGLRRV